MDHVRTIGKPLRACADPMAPALHPEWPMRARGVNVGDVMRWDGVPPMYTFDDPDGNRFYVVEAQ